MANNNENKKYGGLSLIGWLKLLGTVIAAVVAALTAQSCGAFHIF